MKTSISSILILLLIYSCNNSARKLVITEDTFQKIHLVIERSSTDSVKKHLLKFIEDYNIPLTADKLKDGSYYGESPFDDYGYKHVIMFQVEKGRFLNVKYEELKVNGYGKSTDTSYCRRMNEAKPGSSPALSYPSYCRQLELKQDIGKLDGITGATYSKFRFEYAAFRAIAKGPIENQK